MGDFQQLERMIKYVKGNIFNTQMQTVVNTVNCVGVMGKGVALVYKLRYPKMFDLYKDLCISGQIEIGKLWLYNKEDNAPWVLNFPTKRHWKYPSKLEYLEKGLEKFVDTFNDKGITSIAFPLLGTHNGGLDKEEVLRVMDKYLAKCNIPIEVYEYDPRVQDDLFDSFSRNWKSFTSDQLKVATGMRIDKIKLVSNTLESGELNSMIELISTPGLGLKTMERCFRFVMTDRENLTLF